MKIIVAPDKFKGCLTAAQVADAMARGVSRAAAGTLPAIDLSMDQCPMADGGEGLVDAMLAAMGGRRITHRVTGPLPDRQVDADYALLADGKTAVIEMAAASGLHLLRNEERDPYNTTTFGTGELMVHAKGLGATRIILGIGGSATVDGGIGAAQACGCPIILRNAEPLGPDPLRGSDMEMIHMIKHGRGTRLDGVQILVACDVINPLYGPEGAPAIYGPQKGATPEQVQWLDGQLTRLARNSMATDQAQMPGAGAAGGLGWAMVSFLAGTLQSGIDLVIETVGLKQRLAGASLCLTGEGKLDRQSLSGKTAVGVGRLCKELGVPCVALAGSVEIGPDYASHGITASASICNGPIPMDQAMKEASRLVENAAYNMMQIFLSGRDGK